jgi:small-conductance mechanosensitive channel
LIRWEIPIPALAVMVLTLIVVSHLLLRWWLRRQARGWLTRSLNALLPPIVMLVWIHAIALVVYLAIRDADPARYADTGLLGLRWAYGLSVLGAAVWLLQRTGRIIELLLLSVSSRADTTWDDVVLPLAGKTVRYTLPLVALILAAPALSMSPGLAEIVRDATSLILIGVVAFILCQVVDALAAFVLRQHRLDVANNLEARAIHTQVLVLKRVALTMIGIFTLASMLMVFESVRQFGASILASAGVAGIVVGLAAQRSIATLLAGFQVAMTQPIRVDDVVIVEGEWGRVEDITLTYVVVRIWDQRRVIVPMTYFIERPFQNWTHTSSDILGTVFLYVDYSVPVEQLRLELTRILERSRYWDRRVNVLQVTDAREHTLELRALASAADASLAWDLRCEIREQLVAFIQRHHPDSLPRLRASFAAGPLAAAEGH